MTFLVRRKQLFGDLSLISKRDLGKGIIGAIVELLTKYFSRDLSLTTVRSLPVKRAPINFGLFFKLKIAHNERAICSLKERLLASCYKNMKKHCELLDFLGLEQGDPVFSKCVLNNLCSKGNLGSFLGILLVCSAWSHVAIISGVVIILIPCS